MNKVINFGSLNIDHVYQVAHIVRPGETISGDTYHIYCGGKGANQSIALARAGAEVIHVGCVGHRDGDMLVENLRCNHVNIGHIARLGTPSGHAVIQVDANGENAIFLFTGANYEFTPEMIDKALLDAVPGDFVLFQNEINNLRLIMEKAAAAKLRLCFNFAPFDPEAAANLPLQLLSFLIINESEGAGLTDCVEPEAILEILSERYPHTTVILTLGAEGVIASREKELIKVPALAAEVRDTTAAGDTFAGYFLAACLRDESLRRCCEEACLAAAIAVSRPGATDSIPYRHELKSKGTVKNSM